jgi:response regulator NasT
MRREKITEEQAYLKLQKYSMDNRKSMREVAEAIILAEEISK